MDIWIGLVNVIPMPGNNELMSAKGAYVNVIALASSSDDYDAIVKSELSKLDFFVVSTEDVELLTERVKHSTLAQELYSIADDVKRTGDLGLGTFHAYQEDETLS